MPLGHPLVTPCPAVLKKKGKEKKISGVVEDLGDEMN
jgi:hypothetical protein